MRKLAEVEEARKVFSEAVDWSVMRWLREKKRVRRLADEANDALDALEKEVKAQWSATLKAAYESVKNADKGDGKAAIGNHDPHVLATVNKIKEADDISYKAHWDAEDTFAEADRKLSTTLAREGCKKAIDSWDLHEAAIKKAESVLTAKAGK